jgi:hypothetical protein
MARIRLPSLVITILLILGTAVLTRASPHHDFSRLRSNSRRHLLVREFRVGAIHCDTLTKRDETCCPGMFQTLKSFPASYRLFALLTLPCPQTEIATMVETGFAVLAAVLFQQATSAVKIAQEVVVILGRRVGSAVLKVYAVATLLVPA